ncbi:MAG: DUF1761 domain-containing protein [Clostridiales bacterium]|nr:DUF1761 domain-containing protein [Clostridiales bacterium]
MDFNISIVGLIVGTLINMGLGALWYSNVLFSKSWMKEANITEDDIKNPDKMGVVYALTALTALLTSFVLGMLILNLGIDTILEGLFFALVLWVGTNIPPIIKNWGFENRTLKLGMINHGYDLIVYMLVTIVYVLL